MKPSRILTGSQFCFVESPCLITITLRSGRQAASDSAASIKLINLTCPISNSGRSGPYGPWSCFVDHRPWPIMCKAWAGCSALGGTVLNCDQTTIRPILELTTASIPVSNQQPATSNTSGMVASCCCHEIKPQVVRATCSWAVSVR